jgi:hypothetical protein
MRKTLISLTSIGLFYFASSVCAAQSTDSSKALSREILAKSNLHFPNGDSDLLQRLDSQAGAANCERYEVRWSAARDEEMVLAVEAQRKPTRQKFELLSRKPADNCGGSIPPFEFPDVQVLVFGTNEKGEIRGLRLIPHMRDPRVMIVECPGLFGQKSAPNTKCGEFLVSKVILDVSLPNDPEIRQLEFFERVMTGRTEWRLDKLGVLKLVR